MCGINGIVRFDGGRVSESDIIKMNKAVAHRGPDSEGVFFRDGVGIGHRRLAVLDLSSRGEQPMVKSHRGRTVVITFNGEIYNYQEVRGRLEKVGYIFNSNTDTEVILAAYLEYGFDCVMDFNGMFAFAIYDLEKNIIYGARDRFGKKPFKYFLNENKFIFSSELKAILGVGVKREIDYTAIDDFLTLQYVPAPKTGFKSINKLPQSHYFVLDIASRRFDIRRYFDLDFSQKIYFSRRKWMELIEFKLEEAVKRRLIADVPLGVFLSGGVDSSAIVVFMKRFTNKIRTFSIAFKQKDFDESNYARRVAKLYGTKHVEFTVDSNDLISYLDDLVGHYEEPFADSSQLPTFILSKLARDYVTVALSGDGGDENFGGYDKHQSHVITMLFLPILKSLKFLKKYLRNEKLQILFGVLDKSIARRHYNFTSYFDESAKNDFYKDDFKESLQTRDNLFDCKVKGKAFEEMDKVFYLDFNYYIPDDINVKVDMASMYRALEVRSPMLDHEFVSMISKMPWRLKTGVFFGKKIFKMMLIKYLPINVVYRRKHGFSTPIKHWFRNELRDYMRWIILDEKGLVLQIAKREVVEKIINDHLHGKSRERKLWLLMVLNIWYKNYFL